eukprot:4482-Chlamydomonas_euryale.AAC.1
MCQSLRSFFGIEEDGWVEEKGPCGGGGRLPPHVTIQQIGHRSVAGAATEHGGAEAECCGCGVDVGGLAMPCQRPFPPAWSSAAQPQAPPADGTPHSSLLTPPSLVLQHGPA